MTTSSKTLLKNFPTSEEMTAIIYDLKGKDARTVTIMGASYLEYGLEQLLRTHFRDLNKDDSKNIFDGGNAVLATFSAKIRIAYAMSLIEGAVYRDLLLIKDIRNVFAHSLHNIDFTHKLIETDCQKLTSLIELYKVMDFSCPFTSAPDIFLETVHHISLVLFCRDLQTTLSKAFDSIGNEIVSGINIR